MTKPDICVKVIRVEFAADSSATQKSVSSQQGLNKSALSLLVQNIYRHYLVRDDLIIQRVVLDLGLISRQHFSIHFHQRLHSALVKLFLQLEAATRNAPISVREKSERIEEQADRPLLDRAIGWLQAATLSSPAPDIPLVMLYSLLEQAIDTRSAANTASANAAFSHHPTTSSPSAQQENRSSTTTARQTPQHITLLALHYLLLESEGQRWLSQHSLAHEQRDALAAAIVRREIAAEPLLRCIACLEPLPPAQARAIAGRWIIPLWRYPSVAQQVQQQAGKAARQQVEHLLASLLPGRASTPYLLAETMTERLAAGEITPASHPLSPRQIPLATRGSSSQQKTGVRPRQGYQLADETSPPGLPVTNAGIVLYWPLFTQWFTTLGLMEERQFVSEDARWQAVVAMDWLVWEQETPNIERLVINQFLCGLPLSEPPAPLAPLSPELQQRTLAWIEAVSQQLAAFEKMSLADIRLLFLQRPGELFNDLMPAVLNIEPQPFDVLLTKWPWPLNLAYFPWFDVPLIIEWPGSEPAGARL